MADPKIHITADINRASVAKLVQAIESRGKRLPLRRIGVIGLRSILRNFAVGGRPNRWKPLAPATVMRRGAGVPLMDSGTMRNSIGVHLGKDNVKVGTDLQMDGAPYPYYQHHGTRKSSRHPGIPARPFALWQDGDIKAITRLLADHMIGKG